MDRLIIATNNPGKVKEIKAILGGYFGRIISLKEAGIVLDVVEDGETFEENAVKKAAAAAKITGSPALADDSGLCVDALNGAPGVYSARYAGEAASDAENNEKLLKALADVPREKRAAHYACVMALVFQDGKTITSRGEAGGRIATEPAGKNGFGYDPLFYLPEYGCTMAELAPETKNGISHRYHALAALREKLKRL